MAARVVMCSMVVVTQQQELSLCYDQIILALMSTSPPQSSGIVHVLHGRYLGMEMGVGLVNLKRLKMYTRIN